MPTSKPKSELVMAREGKVGKISIDGAIGYDFWDEANSYKSFKKALADMGDVNVIELSLKSPGGVVVDGVAIYNLINEHGASVHTYNAGEAGSMASALLLGGDKVYIPEASMTFIHKPLNIEMGNADDMRKKADELDKFEAALSTIYMKNFKGTEDELKDLMSSETWYTADEMADKFNNVVVISSGGQKAAATSEPVEILGDIGNNLKESFMDRAVNAVRKRTQGNNQEVDMPMTPDEKQEIVAEVTTSILAALDKRDEEAKARAEADEAAQAHNKTKVEFDGDKSDAEAVQAHIDKLKQAEIEASTDWSDPKSVKAYQDAVFGKKEVPASSQTAAHEPRKVSDEIDIEAAVARVTGKVK